MNAPTYAELVRQLFPRLTGGIRWGTDRTERLLAAVGDPHRRFPSVHVGGTNGKGSVSATLASVFRAAGLRCGLYTSPHLCSFRERIQIDGRPISEEALVQAAGRLWPQIRAEEPSFFEATTALAFLAFAEQDVDVVVAEVGLGGRLDATNVLQPAAVALTNVALDHTDFLGETIEAIAGEKAGIIKPGAPVVTAEADPAVLALFRARAAEVGAPLGVLAPEEPGAVHVGLEGTRFALETEAWGRLSLETPLIGRHHARNAALAVRTLEVLPEGLRPGAEAVVGGISHVGWPGRTQCVRLGGEQWIFDVAHNPAGVAALAETLRTLDLPQPLVAVVGILGDKDWRAMLPPLLDLTEMAVLTLPPTAPTHRRWDPSLAAAGLGDGVVVVPAFGAALAEAARLAREGTVLVTGSFHTVGDALSTLGIAPWGVVDALPEPEPAALPGPSIGV